MTDSGAPEGGAFLTGDALRPASQPANFGGLADFGPSDRHEQAPSQPPDSGVAPRSPNSGGQTACESAPAGGIFTPERFSDESRMLAKAVEEFIRGEVLPVNGRLERHESGLMEALLRKAGELGILGVAIPEQYGGLDLPKSQIAFITEKLGIHPSFGISAGVHCGVATLPLLFFGTPEQQRDYLPKLASGEWIGAFALSEAGSGSDALSAAARAVRQSDGSYVLNGTKMWITNGGFADLFTLFARIDGEGFSAFLVERTREGVTASREEEKLGLRGSSTTRVVLDNVRVPAQNLLGEPGKGHRPALYSLNLGRLAIAATALGMCKENLRTAVTYAGERRQFGKSISEFGQIREKLAEMAIRTFVLESMLYRIAGWMDIRFGAIESGAPSAQEQYRFAAEEYSIECAILKVFGTETLDYVVDEALQIHGGYGFSEEFAVAQAYRDSRVFRIFEGTNEINRITMVDQVLRRAKAGRLQLQPGSVVPAIAEAGDTTRAAETALRSVRSHVLSALECAHGGFGEKLIDRQEVCARLADMLIALFATESALLRCRARTKTPAAMLAAAQVFAHTAGHGVVRCYDEVRAEVPGDPLPVEGTVPAAPPHMIQLRREVAAAALDRGGYPW